MKKIFYFITVLILSSSCQNEELESIKPTVEGLQAMKQRIEQLAEEYGLDVEVSEKMLSGAFESISIDSIEKDFQMLASLNGRYVLSQEGNHTMKAERADRKLMLSSGYESYIFTDEHRSYLNYNLALKCSATWTVSDGKATNIYVYPSVEKEGSPLAGFVSYGDAKASGEGIVFSGTYTLTDRKFYYVKYKYSGKCNYKSGTITWG